MRIDYHILWFEDNKSSFDAKKKIVQQIVEDFGFSFPLPDWEVNGDNLANINFDKYDLIFVDLDLAGQSGTKLIDRIRDMDVYTEAIFYSSAGEEAVREELRKYGIDGVYCADRGNDQFEDKVTKVIRNTIKKVQDINNIRGLIMAETSDLDSKMYEIIEILITRYSSEIHSPLIEKIFSEVGMSIKEKTEKFEKWNKTKKIDKLMNDTTMFDASKKLGAIQHIIEIIDHDIFEPHKDGKFSALYKSEIGETRNIFAHVTVHDENGKKILKSKSKEIEFTDEYCNRVRQDLKKYSQHLDVIKNYLIDQADNS